MLPLEANLICLLSKRRRYARAYLAYLEDLLVRIQLSDLDAIKEACRLTGLYHAPPKSERRSTPGRAFLLTSPEAAE